MGLITRTAEAYYNQQQSFTGNGVLKAFTLTTAFFPTLPADGVANIDVFVDDNLINSANYSYSSGVVTFSGNTNNADQLLSGGAPKDGLSIVVKESAKVERFGGYRYIPLADIVNNYLVAYVGDGKLIPTCTKTDVLFHAKRGIQEFSYDISRVEKIQEVQVSSTLSVPMPQDYVHYVRLSYVDDAGVEHIIYPARYTSRPSESILQDDDYNYLFDDNGNLLTGTPVIQANFNKFEHGNIVGTYNGEQVNYSGSYAAERIAEFGKRYGLDPEISQKMVYLLLMKQMER